MSEQQTPTARKPSAVIRLVGLVLVVVGGVLLLAGGVFSAFALTQVGVIGLLIGGALAVVSFAMWAFRR